MAGSHLPVSTLQVLLVSVSGDPGVVAYKHLTVQVLAKSPDGSHVLIPLSSEGAVDSLQA